MFQLALARRVRVALRHLRRFERELDEDFVWLHELANRDDEGCDCTCRNR